MTAPTPGYSRAELLDAYNAFTTRLDAAVSRDTERAEAMAKLRHVCAGAPAGDMPPAPPSFVPLHPLYVPLSDTFRRAPGGRFKGDGDPFGAILLLTVFAVLGIGYVIALMLGWL